MSVESFAHKAAKDLVATWLREAASEVGEDHYTEFLGIQWRVNRPAPYWGVWTEYPILPDGTGVTPVWDETPWGPNWDEPSIPPPGYDELISAGQRPQVILDIAIQHKGMLHSAIEIVHKSPPSNEKLNFLAQQDLERIVILPARWVLGQVSRPRACPSEFWWRGRASNYGLPPTFR